MVGYNDVVVGTCGLCGGPVVVPRVYWSVTRPVPQCARCGAFVEESYGPRLPMRPRKRPDGYWRNDPNTSDGFWPGTHNW